MSDEDSSTQCGAKGDDSPNDHRNSPSTWDIIFAICGWRPDKKVTK